MLTGGGGGFTRKCSHCFTGIGLGAIAFGAIFYMATHLGPKGSATCFHAQYLHHETCKFQHVQKKLKQIRPFPSCLFNASHDEDAWLQVMCEQSF